MSVSEKQAIETLIKSVIYRRDSAYYPAFPTQLNELFAGLSEVWALAQDTIDANFKEDEFWNLVREELKNLIDEQLREYERGDDDINDEEDLNYPSADMDDPNTPNF